MASTATTTYTHPAFAIDPMTEARGWLDDCFSGVADDYPPTLSDDQVVAAVERHYFGGWEAFQEECL